MVLVILTFGSHSVTIPQELSDQIIEQLRDDKASLKSCSLVCRSWLFSSRIILFHKLVFTSENVAQLSMHIIQPPCSTIPLYVRRIEFQDIKCLFQNGRDSSLLDHFSPRVTHLHLRDTSFNSFVAVLDVICAFHCLQFLGLDNVQWASAGSAEQSAIQNRVLPLSVVHLRLYHIDLRTFSGWLLSHPKLPTVPRLEIGPIEEHNILHAGKYMVLIGSSLKHLSMSFGFGDNNVQFCQYNPPHRNNHGELEPNRLSTTTVAKRYLEAFGIASCGHFASLTNLNTLCIEGFVDFSASHQSTAWFWAPRLIASIGYYSIKHIVLGLTLTKAGEVDAYNINWDFFDVVFTSDEYANLCSVEFVVGGRVNMDGLASLVEYRLPKAASRGLLRFSRSL